MYEARFNCAACAVKRVPRDKVTSKSIKDMMAEIRMMSRLRHPGIIQFLGCCFDPYVCLVLELAARGSLKALLRSEDFSFAWSRHASMALDVARALHYLHTAFEPPIIHRDVKPDNVRFVCSFVVWRVDAHSPSHARARCRCS